MIDKFIAQEAKKMEYPISKSSLSDIINKYVDLGFVEKHECSDDKRIIYLQLTVEGDKIGRELIDIEEAFKKNYSKDLTLISKKLLKLNLIKYNRTLIYNMLRSI